MIMGIKNPFSTAISYIMMVSLLVAKQPSVSHWQTLSHKFHQVYLTTEDSNTLVVMGSEYTAKQWPQPQVKTGQYKYLHN